MYDVGCSDGANAKDGEREEAPTTPLPTARAL